jgi:lipopolysaccharide export system protein LptA
MGHISNKHTDWTRVSCQLFGNILLFLLWAMLFFSTSALSAEEVLEQSKTEAANATKITAQEMRYQSQGNVVSFLGNVHVQRTDFELWSEQLTIYLSKDAATSSSSETSLEGIQGASQFDKIVAEDKVRLKMEARQATSSKATYERKKELLVLEGNVLLEEGKNTIKGNKVLFYIKENRSEILSAPKKQVEAVFYPSSENEQD